MEYLSEFALRDPIYIIYHVSRRVPSCTDEAIYIYIYKSQWTVLLPTNLLLTYGNTVIGYDQRET
jgi:hypothetical protein